MNFKKTLSAVALGMAAMAAHAGPTITNADGTFSFGGIDWHSNATAFTIGFNPVPNDIFTLKYYAWATSILNADGNSLPQGGLDNVADGVVTPPGKYEYTIVATLTEKTGPICAPGSFCSFQLISGTFDIYYDVTPDANSQIGTGFGAGVNDAVKIMSGTFTPGPSGNFTAVSATAGSGSSTLGATVTYVNTDYILGLGVGTQTSLAGSIQQGVHNGKRIDTRTGVNKPLAFEGLVFNTALDPLTGVAPNQVFQADQNQDFAFAVPEPSSLALVGLALAAGGVASTRRRLKK